MNARLADHVVNESHLIDDLTQRRGHFGQMLAALAELLPRPRRGKRRPVPILKQLNLLTRIPRLAIPLDEFRLVVEQIDMRGGSRHEELHDARRLRREVHHIQHAPARRDDRLRRRLRAARVIPPQHRSERHAPESTADLPQQITARERF